MPAAGISADRQEQIAEWTVAGHLTFSLTWTDASSSGARKKSRAMTIVPIAISRPATGSAPLPSSASSRNAPSASAIAGSAT